MPIYEYRRPDGSTFEIQQSFSDEPLAVDPESGLPVQRVFHPPAVHFKGKGFYNTDYGTRNRQRESAAEKASEKSSSDGSSGDSSKSSGSDSPDKGGKGEKGGKADKADKAQKSAGKDSSKAGESKPLPSKS